MTNSLLSGIDMRLRTSLVLLLLATNAVSRTASSQTERKVSGPDAPTTLRLARIFSSGMVLQRQTAIPVWGWSAPGAAVSAMLDQRTRSTTADRTGAWTITFPPLPAGGPHALTVRSARDSVVLRDLLVGDVWIASGQSNMEFTVSQGKNAAAEIAAATDPRIRHFKVPTSYAEAPERDLAGGSWTSADPAHVGAFSAVAYFFARDLRKSVDVPIGIVNTTWGGSRIETWMSRPSLGMDDAKWNEIWTAEQLYQKKLGETLRAKLGDLPTADAGLVAGRAVWADSSLDDASWATIKVPSLWEAVGYAGMDGIVWYRTSFTLSAEEAARGVTLGLGMIDDADISWVNGVEVGRTNSYNAPRNYSVPASALRPGRNVIAVRVDDTGGGGGIYGDSSALFVKIGDARRAFTAPWKLRVGLVKLESDGQHVNKVPTIVYNKMVHPILSFPIKGFLWYQGESNADRVEDAAAYAPLFKAMITSWRREWGVRDAPFLWVQLANFMAPDSQPAARSAWAVLRDAQTAALTLPRTGQAVIIDVGDEHDIHPTNKQDVGARLALAARAVAYGQRLVHAGPTHRSHSVRDRAMVVQFDHAGGGLVNRAAAARLGGFAIAGADRKFVWADARIEGNAVVVSSSQVPTPVAVRYAWGNNPNTASLGNRDGLPAVPFRTDAW
ncbi:MAG: sialate O-acetylesterase [Gemmatimonadaceae bacterium]